MPLVRVSLCLALLSLTQCSSCKIADPAPILLPAETQNGAYTFGCLVNGKPFVASGITRTRGDWPVANSLTIGAHAGNKQESVNINLLLTGLLNSNAVYALQPQNTGSSTTGFSAFCSTEKCEYDGTRIKKGSLTLTRFDGVARIAAGRFAFTLYEPGCDTLRVTDGRFDMRF
ncbi:hypothetical protein [Hymenobacter fodinae]|uniref:Lipoprotein n=1 Tax=Hymenobacter fodinae TaxID=2510796 RepID=A0A4Z0P2B2_9BACT|nr:hypothetical protein [Hymenobacter fodinae]TGE05381.1 hypothetical protein EU556_18915 [Hymenobacter fodinae]